MKKILNCIPIFALLFVAYNTLAQPTALDRNNILKDFVFKGNHIQLDLTACILPKAKITKDSGYYRLQSNLQSSYAIGLNYIFNVNTNVFISTGFHILVGKRNFFF